VAFNITEMLPISVSREVESRETHLMTQIFRWVIRDALSIEFSCDLKVAPVKGGFRQN
jgi:hypothetical protein